MKELLETLIKSQRERLEEYKIEEKKYYAKNRGSNERKHALEYGSIVGKKYELGICLNQLINLYNQIKNDSESTTTI